MKRLVFTLLACLALLLNQQAWADCAIDGGATTSVAANPSPVFTVPLTTIDTNDLVILLVNNNLDLTGGFSTVSTVADTAALTWTRLPSSQNAWNGTFANEEIWYATTSSPLTSDTITVTLNTNSAASYAGRIIALGVNGYNTGTIFDPNAALPAFNKNNAGTTSNAVTISTTNADDLLLGFLGVNGGTVPSRVLLLGRRY